MKDTAMVATVESEE